MKHKQKKEDEMMQKVEMKKFIAFIACIAMVVTMMPVVGMGDYEAYAATEGTYDLASGSIVVTATAISGVVQYEVAQEGNPTVVTTVDAITITQSNSSTIKNTLTIHAENGVTASAILSGVNINVSNEKKAALTTSGDGDVVIVLEGTNKLQSGENHAGLEKKNTGKLIINNSNNGVLEATGGKNGAGIGGGKSSNGSDITISGGAVTAVGGDGGAGIGGGDNGACDNIIINGGTVTATGKGYAAGIGGGKDGTTGNITISGIASGGSITAEGTKAFGAVPTFVNGPYTITDGTDDKEIEIDNLDDVTKAAIKLHEHTGGTATCKERATCPKCNTTYGDLDKSNHVGTTTGAWSSDSSTHWQTYSCCNAKSGVAAHTYADTTCTVCGYIRTISSGGSGGGGSYTPPQTPSSKAENDINNAKEGEAVQMTLSAGNSRVDATVFEAMAGKDITLEIKAGDVIWVINGKDIPEDVNLKTLNLAVKTNTDNIRENVVKDVAWDKETMQLSLSYNGDFGFTLTMQVDLGSKNKGLFANLYYYNPRTRAMEFETSAIIESNGLAALDFTHASEYAVVIDSEDHGAEKVIENPFTDVAEGTYYYDAVLWALENNITSGMTETTFAPNSTCTRAQFVTFLWRANGSPKVTGVANPFTDVAEGEYYYDAVLWALSEGITSGTSATEFSPNEKVTRGQVATFLWRAAGSPKLSGIVNEAEHVNGFIDVEADAFYSDAVLWAVENNITNGTGDGKFSPDADCTRGQVVTFLYRNFVK